MKRALLLATFVLLAAMAPAVASAVRPLPDVNREVRVCSPLGDGCYLEAQVWMFTIGDQTYLFVCVDGEASPFAEGECFWLV